MAKTSSLQRDRKDVLACFQEFSFDSTGEKCDVLKEALTRYMGLVFSDANEKLREGLPQITKLSVKAQEKYAPQLLESDESCKY